LTWGVVVAALVASGICASTALGDSIVYVGSDGNVWMVHPNGHGRLRVTHDGSPARGGLTATYSSPSETAAGTIVVEKNRDFVSSTADIVRMNRQGRVLSSYRVKEPTTTSQPSSPPYDLRVSPDGRTVTWWYFYNTQVCLSFCQNLLVSLSQVSASNRLTPDPNPGSDETHPVWMGNGRILSVNSGALSTSPTLDYFDRGRRKVTSWFSAATVFGASTTTSFQYPHAISPDGSRLAVEVRAGTGYYIDFFGISNAYHGSPPGAGAANCHYTAPGRAVPESLSWSPNGHALAFVAGGYLTTITLPTLKSCAGASVQRVLRNVTDPYWTAANIKPKH
jgi:hypothetical protein